MDWLLGTKAVKTKKQKKKHKIKRGDIVCTCGALNTCYSTLHYLHDDDCIINTKGKSK